jgi:IstB-like ATP binding protein/Integrase core domain
LWIGEQLEKVHLFVFTLGYSRRLYAHGYHHERLTTLLDGHERAFRWFGGVTLSCLYDNPRNLVLGRREHKVLWHPQFEDLARYYGFTPRACQPYRARTKGKVENGVKYVKRNALAGRRFSSWDDLNDWLERWCVEVADLRIYGTTHERPIDRLAHEQLTPWGRGRLTIMSKYKHAGLPTTHCDGRRRALLGPGRVRRPDCQRARRPRVLRVLPSPAAHRTSSKSRAPQRGDGAGALCRIIVRRQQKGCGNPTATVRSVLRPTRRGDGARPQALRAHQPERRRCGLMSTPQLDRLREHCHQLRLHQIEQELTTRLEQAAKKDTSYADFLDLLLACEVDAKTHKHHQMRIAMARFPYQKTLESFDFKFQPSIDPKQIRELATGRYIQSGDNLLLLGYSGRPASAKVI